ncbi:hypothetical protein B0T18DRAFT_428483 [Schizothecium vesticola]|uniref:BTB domain-containing protein n=1 Tax=Schizothecium vesticola TaxID=314040 RepID=A0AA40K957_9PEZI|nr:hypothetical protein B0T18DRAFT_428483 [Schizothecium vesticola]
MAQINNANKVKDEPTDNGAPIQPAANIFPPANNQIAYRRLHAVVVHGSPGHGGIPRGCAARGGSAAARGFLGHGGIPRGGVARGDGSSAGGVSTSGAAPARGGSAAARGGVVKARRAGAGNLGALNAAPRALDAVASAVGLATPSPGPAPASAPVSGSTTSAAETGKKPRKQRASTATQGPQPKPFAVTSNQERRFTGGDLSLLESGAFYDALIVSKGHQWKVHKTILCPRSAWFREAFGTPTEDGCPPVANLHNFEVRDIDILLRFIYAGSLDEAQFDPRAPHASFEQYARLFHLATTFALRELTNDAKTLLGRFCDRHLQTLCAYDPATSGRNGHLADSPRTPPFTPPDIETDLQLLLAAFCYGGRTRLFTFPDFRDLAYTCPAFGNTIFKLMLPGMPASEYAPVAVCVTASGVDHTHRSQHPDRCAHCDRTFADSARRRKAMFNPFEANVRASTYCATCVEKNQGQEAPLWRMEAEPAKV